MTDKQKASNESPLCWVRPATTTPDLGGFQVCREGDGFPVWAHPNGMYAPVSAEPVAHPMEEIMGYRLEFKPGEYCYYTPEGYALEAYKGDAPIHALYANPRLGCPSEIEVYKGWCWVRPKYNAGVVDETFCPLFLGPQLGATVAAQAQQPVSGADEKVEFEKSIGENFDLEPSSYARRGYAVPVTQAAWEGWQARAALAQQDAKSSGKQAAVVAHRRVFMSDSGVVFVQAWQDGEPDKNTLKAVANNKNCIIEYAYSHHETGIMVGIGGASIKQESETRNRALPENQGVTKQDADKD